MVVFDLWTEAFFFGLVFSLIILVPCFLIAWMGVNMINQLGTYPSKAPEILMRYCIPYVILTILSIGCILGFYLFFA